VFTVRQLLDGRTRGNGASAADAGDGGDEDGHRAADAAARRELSGAIVPRRRSAPTPSRPSAGRHYSIIAYLPHPRPSVGVASILEMGKNPYC